MVYHHWKKSKRQAERRALGREQCQGPHRSKSRHRELPKGSELLREGLFDTPWGSARWVLIRAISSLERDGLWSMPHYSSPYPSLHISSLDLPPWLSTVSTWVEVELCETMPNAAQGFLIPQGSIQVPLLCYWRKCHLEETTVIQPSCHSTLEKHPDQGIPLYTLSHVLSTHCFVGSLRGETWFSWVVIATGTPQHPKQHIKSTLHSVHQYLGYQFTFALPTFHL